VYRIKVERQAIKALARLPLQDQSRVGATIDKLAEDPRPTGCMPVRTTEPGTYRLRVGNYRVIYIVLDSEQVIIIARVAKRGEDTYKGL